jgi:hypothetical protein
MMASAPLNNWGTVGVAPNAIQLASIRILEHGQTSFPFDAYASGIAECLRLRGRYDIRTINLSLGSSEAPSSESYEAVANAIERANAYGVAVVAAAGNDDGGPVEYPAAYPGVLGVAASDTAGGALCSFSNWSEGLLLAPGCDLDGADPASGEAAYDYWQGSSEASAITDAALTALLAYKPALPHGKVSRISAKPTTGRSTSLKCSVTPASSSSWLKAKQPSHTRIRPSRSSSRTRRQVSRPRPIPVARQLPQL